MTTFRDPDRLIDAFLKEGPTELPDRAYAVISEEIEQTKQRVVIGPRRISDMNTFAKLAIAAAVLIAVGFAGINLLPSNSGVGGVPQSPIPTASPTPSPTPTASPTPTSTPAPTPRADEVPGGDASAMAPGSWAFYRFDGQRELRVSFSVDDGWFGHESWYILNNGDGDPFRADVATLAVWEWSIPQESIGYVWADACIMSSFPDELGPTVGDLVEALVAQEPRDTKPPTDITVDGYSGVAIESIVASDIKTSECGDHLEAWRERGTNQSQAANAVSQRWLVPGLEETFWVLDVEGSRLLIEASFGPEASAEDRAAMRRIMESIRFSVS
jgi:hypothetical protein